MMDGAASGFSENRLDLRERQLDWIEVRAVGWQEKHARAVRSAAHAYGAKTGERQPVWKANWMFRR